MNILLELKKLKDLSSSERQVVVYILGNPSAAVNIGIVELAQRSFTSSSTVMRVCKRVGFDSYVNFRSRIAQDYCDYVETDLTFNARPPEIIADASIEDTIKRVTANNAHAVATIQSINSCESIRRVVDMMSEAKQWDFYGMGISNLICQDAMLKAMRLGIPCTAYTYNSQLAIQTKLCDKTHLAFFVSYTGQTVDILNLAESIRSAGVPSVSITSQTDNDLLELCGVNLFVDSLESIYRIGGMSSRISTLHLFDILFSVYMNDHADSSRDMARRTFIADTFGKSDHKS